MKKEQIRKEFFKLKQKGHSYSQCSKILYAKYSYEVNPRTLQRWMNRLDNDDTWDLKDDSRRPKIIHRKITKEIEEEVISIKKKTGLGAEKIEEFVNLSHTTINKILNKNNLEIYNSLRKLRNIAAHANEFNLNMDLANEYAFLVNYLLQYLKSYKSH